VEERERYGTQAHMHADHAAMMMNIYSIYSVNFGDLAEIQTQIYTLTLRFTL